MHRGIPGCSQRVHTAGSARFGLGSRGARAVGVGEAGVAAAGPSTTAAVTKWFERDQKERERDREMRSEHAALVSPVEGKVFLRDFS